MDNQLDETRDLSVWSSQAVANAKQVIKQSKQILIERAKYTQMLKRFKERLDIK